MTTSARWPGVVFQGRDFADRRINLSLINSQGMSSALRGVWDFYEDNRKIRQRLEEVLKLFARWNWDLFPEIQELKGYHRVWPGSYTSFIDGLRAENGLVIQPFIGVGNAEDVAASIFEAVKFRVQVMAPDCPLLIGPNHSNQVQAAKPWSLYYIWKSSRSVAEPCDGFYRDNFCGLLRLVILKQGAHASTETSGGTWIQNADTKLVHRVY
ncbi:hypothetical protein KC363_g6555 [Hortaea werneckii]|nr:hypothetical protein KC361_g6355 [Hortaea werneckii]KAI6881915.1 hypothetical protein KC325_g6187 [Hortaea werneckii]KAI6990145.1 hypothetical protein KC359_g6849 [Hortaea werneckii]KAI7143501.1 hypothetical protein KC344_g6233 [Hortaea werneckii]KAI7171170.1 hypothetical protein KC360_g6301 [Hortaea werneckii]